MKAKLLNILILVAFIILSLTYVIHYDGKSVSFSESTSIFKDSISYKKVNFTFQVEGWNLTNVGKGYLIYDSNKSEIENIHALEYWNVKEYNLAKKDDQYYIYRTDENYKTKFKPVKYFIDNKKIISPIYILKSSAYLKAHKIIGGILVVFSLLLSLLIISNCFHFLVELFFDRPFTYKTLAWLKYNYIVTFFTPLIAFLFSYIEGLLNNSIFNSDVYFNYFKFFETYRGFWIFAFVFYCLHKAFKKGYHYTEDQALTI